MAGGKTFVYWDACVFIAFLKGDKPAAEIKEGIRYWSDRARSGKVTLVTSTLTITEVVRFHHQDKYRMFTEFMRRHVTRRAADHIVCQRAHAFRDHFTELGLREHEARKALAEEEARIALERKQKVVKPLPVKAPRKLATQDAIHLATATIYDCVAFHTFDGESQRDTPFLKLLHLNGQIPNFTIPITLPRAPGSEPMDLFDIARGT